MKKLVVLALLAAGLGATAAAFASNSRQAAPAGNRAVGNKLIACGKTRTIGFLAPVTGPAASIGGQQVRWAKWYVSQYNKTHKKTKFKLHTGDTQLGTGVANAVSASQSVVADSSVLGVVGPAGSNEVKATTATLKGAGVAFVTGSATNTQLTTDGTRRGYFFRAVPPDAVQGRNVATFIIKKLKSKRVYIIDDQEAYSTGLADTVQKRLQAAGVNVKRDGISQTQSSFSSVIAKIARNTQLVYLPWQLASQAQAFGKQMKQAGKGSITLMGSDGLFDPTFASVGKNVYDSNFPVNPKDPIIKKYQKAHKGKGEYFGTPTFVAAQVVGGAIDRACKDGKATRGEVRAQVRKTNIRKSALGLRIKYDRNGDIAGGRFGLYKSNGKDFVPLG